MTRERNRTTKLIDKARSQNLQCYVYLHIASKMDHDDILDELFEDIGRACKRITFPTVEIPKMPCIRSEQTRTSCIAPEDAAIVDGELRDILSLGPSTYVDHKESQIWHFAGDIWLLNEETCFCEYDASKREGGMIIFFDGKDIPWILQEYPQLKQKIKIAKCGQYDWLVDNW